MKKFLWAGLVCCGLVILPATLPAAAQRKRPAKQADPCANAETQYELNRCAGAKYQRADAELNRVYQQLMGASGSAGEKLKAAQTAWLKFRDAECDYAAFFYEGGSMQPMIRSFCLADVTAARTKQLRDSLKELQAER